MLMDTSKQNRKFSSKLAIAAVFYLVLASSANSPCYGGSQSLLDPYANIQAPTSQPETKSANGGALKKSRPAKTAKVPEKTAPAQVSANTSATAKNNPGFFSGIKEIQHGYVTTFKAAGSGIVNGSKSMGAKIAAGGGKIKDGLGSAGTKISSGSKAIAAKTPHAKKNVPPQSVAQANSSALGTYRDSAIGALPGKPLESLEQPKSPHLKKSKPLAPIAKAPIGTKNKNVVAKTFDKFNIFAKHKKPTNIAANNQKPGG